MGDLLDLIFSNFLVVAAIIGGIISFFSGAGKKEQQADKPARPMPSSSPAPEKVPEQKVEADKTSGEDRLKRYYEEKQQRLNEVQQSRERMRGSERRSSGPGPQVEVTSAQSAGTGRKEVSVANPKSWNKKKLAEGILMAEVLGPPRAHKPHSSHPRKR
ncbi:hypothetical protein [Halobacillus sp. KGW1]|uniref:hypothetical protein n=1 Tax=Halobacillus sp. KGW1 TaxID=1793726 RepID=UPI00078168AD|nr:hypothetical protein [Halobacillus sp. KGW1]